MTLLIALAILVYLGMSVLTTGALLADLQKSSPEIADKDYRKDLLGASMRTDGEMKENDY